jgi:hypothetical protein
MARTVLGTECATGGESKAAAGDNDAQAGGQLGGSWQTRLMY